MDKDAKRARAQDFIIQVLLTSADRPDLDSHRYYADTISPYYSLPSASWSEVEKEKELCFRRSPVRHYSLVGELGFQEISDAAEIVDFDLRYSFVRPDGKTGEGISHETWNLIIEDGRCKISGAVDDSSENLEKKNGELWVGHFR